MKKVMGMEKKVTLVVLDIDGVLNSGKAIIDSHGMEYKTINYRDLDGINYLEKKGVRFALLTGEDTNLVDILAERYGIRAVLKGAKDKAAGLLKLSKTMGVSLKNICYIGDSDRDAEGLRLAGLSFVPKDATGKAKKAASHVFTLKGGAGVIQELKEYLLKNNYLRNE